MPHTDDYTFIGNIVTTSGDDPSLTCAKIEISDLGEFNFEGRHLIVEGPKWRESDTEYDYETLTRKKLRKVNKYKAYWTIKAKFMGRNTYATLAELESLMEQVNHEFSSSGVHTPRQFYFYPPGDSTRPVIEVVKVSPSVIDIEHFGNKYIGYGPHELVIESVEEFINKILPRTEPMITLPDYGSAMIGSAAIAMEL